MHVSRDTAPRAEVFDNQALAHHLRIDLSDSVHLVEARAMASAAVAELEEHASIAMITQKIRLTLDAWPENNVIILPVGPVPPFSYVTMTVDGEPFNRFSLYAGPRGSLRLYGQRPETALIESGPAEGLVIEYEPGFGNAAHNVPDDLRLAVLDQAAAFFDVRGAGDGKTQHLSPHAARIAARYRRVAL